MSLVSMNRSKLLFIKSQTLPLSMHHKWKVYWHCMQNNQWKIKAGELKARGSTELMDNSTESGTNLFHISIYEHKCNYGHL
jgi:hypothetical protein